MPQEADKKEFNELITYKDAVAKRSKMLEETSRSQEEFITSFSERVNSSKSSFISEASGLKEDIRQLKAEISEAKIAIVSLVSQMRYSVKKDELARLEKKSEAWSPRGFVIRKEARKTISKLQ